MDKKQNPSPIPGLYQVTHHSTGSYDMMTHYLEYILAQDEVDKLALGNKDMHSPTDTPLAVCLSPCLPGAINVPTLRGMRLSGTGTRSSGMATVRNTFPGSPIQARPFVPLPRSCSRAATANTLFALLPCQTSRTRGGGTCFMQALTQGRVVILHIVFGAVGRAERGRCGATCIGAPTCPYTAESTEIECTLFLQTLLPRCDRGRPNQ